MTDGSLLVHAGRDVTGAAATTTTGDMIYRADNDGTGPGVLAGTVNITCGPSCLTETTAGTCPDCLEG